MTQIARHLRQAASFAAVFARVLCLFLASSLCGQSATARGLDSPADALQHHFDSAKSALAAGDLSRADAVYRETIALALRQLANLSMSEAQFDRAAELLSQALKLTPGDPELQIDAGVAAFRKGEIKKATDLVQAVIADHPDNPRAHNVLGRINLFKGDAAGSIVELQRAVTLQQDDFETAYFLGIAYLKAKRQSDAAQVFSKMQEAAVESAALHVLFGRAYTVTHFPAPAVTEFRKAVKLDPKYPRAHTLLAYASLELNGESFYPQARTLFEQELRTLPDDYFTLVLLGITTTSLRDFGPAEKALLHATTLRPQGATPFLYLGEIYSSTHRFTDAVSALQNYVKLMRDPEEAPRDLSRAYYLLGQDLLRLGRTDEAKQALANSQRYREAKFKYDVQHIFDEPQPAPDGDSRPTVGIASLLESGAPEEQKTAEAMLQAGMLVKPGTETQPAPVQPSESPATKRYRAFAGEILASSYNDLGVMRAKDSKFAEAAELFQQAVVWNPALAGLDRNWGLAAYRAEKYADAVPPLERQLAAHPDDNFARQLLGMSYFMTENYSKTAEVLRPFLSNPPDDPGLLLAWGTALVRTHQSSEASGIFRQLLETNAANPGVHFLLGQAYAQQQDYPNALAELKKTIQLDPQLTEAHYYTGLVYLHQSQFAPAAEEFRAELQLRPADLVTKYHLAFALLSQGNAEQAAGLLKEVVQAKPDYELAHFELGRASLQLGDLASAIENLEIARRLAPEHEAALFQLSQAYRRAGRLPEAEQALAGYRKLIEESRLKRRESLEADKP